MEKKAKGREACTETKEKGGVEGGEEQDGRGCARKKAERWKARGLLIAET